MPVDRFFVNTLIERGHEVALEGQEHHHLAHVARVRKGETVDVVNGKGGYGRAVVLTLEKNRATLRIEESIFAQPPPFKSVLIQAIPRMNRLEFIVEKGTELGMWELKLFPGEKGEKNTLSEHQLKRLNAIAVGAMKQSGRLYLPEITLSPPLAKWVTFPSPCFFGDLSHDAPTLMKAWKDYPIRSEIFFVVGPESGLSENETGFLSGKGGVGVSLHENTLRTDTAAIASLSVIHQLALAESREVKAGRSH